MHGLSAYAGLDISPEGALFTDDDVHEGIAITKDLFLLVIQDPPPRSWSLLHERKSSRNRLNINQTKSGDMKRMKAMR